MLRKIRDSRGDIRICADDPQHFGALLVWHGVHALVNDQRQRFIIQVIRRGPNLRE